MREGMTKAIPTRKREDATLRGNNTAPERDGDDAIGWETEDARLKREIVRLFGEPVVRPPIFDPEVGIYPVED